MVFQEDVVLPNHLTTASTLAVRKLQLDWQNML